MSRLPLRRATPSRGAAPFAAAVALVAALIAMTYFQTPTPKTSRLRVEDLPQLLVEAAQGLNQSLRLLSFSTKHELNASNHAGRMRVLALLLQNATELEELWGSELGQGLLEASGNYSKLALAAAHVAEAAQAVSSVREQLREFLEGIEACNFGRAESVAPALEGAAERASGELVYALHQLAEVKEQSLLSDGHRELYRTAIEQVQKWLKMLSNLSKAAKIVKLADKVQLEESCRARGSVSFGSDVVGLALTLNPSESGEFGYEVGLLKSYILGEPQRRNGTAAPEAGSGAGWGGPAGDD